MSVRINKARNFKGKAYVAADELDNLINSLTFANNGSAITSKNEDGTWNVTFKYADQLGNNTSTTLDLTKIKDYIDNKAIEVVAGNGVTIDATDPLAPVIKTNLKITKVATETGYAASYKLQYQSGTDANNNNSPIYSDVTGDVINIVKDQFIKSAAFGWSTAADSSGAGWTTTKSTTAVYPCIKIDVWTNEDGDATTTEQTAQSIYVPLVDTFQEYKAGDAIAINADANDGKLVISAVKGTSEQVSIADSSTVDVLTIDGTGIGVTNIQKAINYAVDNEHAKASAAISAVDSNVVALATSVNAAVTSINTRVADVETHAATAVANASANLSTQIAGVATNASAAVSKIASALDALDGAVDTAITSVNTNVETAIDSVVANVRGALATTVTNVNTAVSAAVDTVNTKVKEAVTSVNTQVGAFKNTVSATIDAEQAAVSSFMGSVNTVISAVEANRNTQLARAVQMIEDGNVALTSQAGDAGIYHATVTANNIVAVYDPAGIQIYPEISRTGAAKPYTYTLEAEYGSSVADGHWTVLYTIDLPEYVDGGNVTYAGGANTIAYTNAGNGTNASYDTTTAAGEITAVDATDVDYDGVADVAGTGVANGTAGTAGTGVATGSDADAPTVPDHVTKDAPNYTGHTNA